MTARVVLATSADGCSTKACNLAIIAISYPLHLTGPRPYSGRHPAGMPPVVQGTGYKN